MHSLSYLNVRDKSAYSTRCKVSYIRCLMGKRNTGNDLRESQFINVSYEEVDDMSEKLQAVIGYRLPNSGLATMD